MKLLHGVGINDADYKVRPNIDGKRAMCSFYQKWTSMLKRCYSEKYQEKNPTYKGCSVVGEWLTFSNFKAWMVKQEWSGNHLDKDFLVEGNKVYGPNTCVFIGHQLNSLLNDRAAARGDYPLGVSKYRNNYQASIRDNGIKTHLGSFSTPEEAHNAWRKAKATVLLESRVLTKDIKVKEALTARAWSLLC